MSKQKRQEIPETEHDTRERIIDAAYNVLAEKGYEAATLIEISKAADAAPGLIHYYFGGKDHLLVEVIKTVNDRYTQMLEQSTLPTETQNSLAMILQEPLDRVIEEPKWYRLRHELFALGLHNALIAPQVRENLADGRQSIAMLIEQTLGETTVDPLILATLLLAFFDGVALQKIMDPDLDISEFGAVLAHILHCFKGEHR